MTRSLTLASLALASCLAACSSGHGSAGSSASAGSAASAGSTGSTATGGGAGGQSTTGSSSGVGGAVSGLGPPAFDPGELDAPSDGATITFQQIGATGWFPSRRDPATGPCDALDNNGCCLAKQDVTGDDLTPWDEDLVLTLRGPMLVKQLAVYQPAPGDATRWDLVSGWDSDKASAAHGLSFDGNATPSASFAGGVGSECSVNVSTSTPFACGAGSLPYCPASSSEPYQGWAGSKLFVMLATMPHAGEAKAPTACSTGTTGNWYDASWMGLGLGELARAGAYASCQCFAKDPAKWYLADGCGQFNVFEVVNDNDSSKNLDVLSTDMIDYAGYVGQGPCGPACDVSKLGAGVDLIDKKTYLGATQGAVATPAGGPSAAFRRPSSGYRYFLVALDVGTRTVQLGIVHPQKVPASIAGLLPALPGMIPRSTVDAVLGLRLPM